MNWRSVVKKSKLNRLNLRDDRAEKEFLGQLKQAGVPVSDKRLAINLTTEFVHQRHRMLYGFGLAGERGYTDEQAAKAAGVNLRSCFWKRAGELRKFGYIEPVRIVSGPDKGWQEMRKGDLGGTQGVWRITKAGRHQLQVWGR
jgi:hypothetical protein